MVLKAVNLHELYRVRLDWGVRKVTDGLLSHDPELQQLYRRDEVVCRITFSSCCSRAGAVDTGNPSTQVMECGSPGRQFRGHPAQTGLLGRGIEALVGNTLLLLLRLECSASYFCTCSTSWIGLIMGLLLNLFSFPN